MADVQGSCDERFTAVREELDRQLDTLREVEVARGHRVAHTELRDVDLNLGRDVGRVGGDADRVGLELNQRVRRRLADDGDRDLDLHLLTAADGDEVDVVDGLLQRVALHVLGERELPCLLAQRLLGLPFLALLLASGVPFAASR